MKNPMKNPGPCSRNRWLREGAAGALAGGLTRPAAQPASGPVPARPPGGSWPRRRGSRRSRTWGAPAPGHRRRTDARGVRPRAAASRGTASAEEPAPSPVAVAREGDGPVRGAAAPRASGHGREGGRRTPSPASRTTSGRPGPPPWAWEPVEGSIARATRAVRTPAPLPDGGARAKSRTPSAPGPASASWRRARNCSRMTRVSSRPAERLATSGSASASSSSVWNPAFVKASHSVRSNPSTRRGASAVPLGRAAARGAAVPARGSPGSSAWPALDARRGASWIRSRSRQVASTRSMTSEDRRSTASSPPPSWRGSRAPPDSAAEAGTPAGVAEAKTGGAGAAGRAESGGRSSSSGPASVKRSTRSRASRKKRRAAASFVPRMGASWSGSRSSSAPNVSQPAERRRFSVAGPSPYRLQSKARASIADSSGSGPRFAFSREREGTNGCT